MGYFTKTVLLMVRFFINRHPRLLIEIMQMAASMIEQQKKLIVSSDTMSMEDKWTEIYKLNSWKGGLGGISISGPGSSLVYTANLRKGLVKLFSDLGVKSVLDAPCGDFLWMKSVVEEYPIQYVGADIVKPLIDTLNVTYGNAQKTFLHIDLTKDPLPYADLMICRDIFFHLPFADTRAILANYVASGIPFLLTTTHKNTNQFSNQDIKAGGFRTIDLLGSPYHFPPDPIARIDDWVPPNPEREMCLWSREHIICALSKFSLT